MQDFSEHKLPLFSLIYLSSQCVATPILGVNSSSFIELIDSTVHKHFANFEFFYTYWKSQQMIFLPCEEL